MEDLPKGVVLEWRNWCSKKDYFFDKSFHGKTIPEYSYQNINFPIKVFYSPDDTISGEANTLNFWKHVKSSKEVSIEKLNKDMAPLTKIDHFGYFKEEMKDFFWANVLREIDNFLLDRDQA